uniref:Uncharacterized protein n=1 Tax=Sphaerodactylus townsendi TaxID=933632 RepID=A0ACB8ERR9_9SAUR
MKLTHPLLLLSLLAAAAAEFNGHKAPGLRRRSDSAVKLCGPDFIRAIHFNCGASRSKKRSESQAAEERLHPGFVLPISYEGMEDPKERSSFDFSKREIEDEIWQYISELINDIGLVMGYLTEYCVQEESVKTINC